MVMDLEEIVLAKASHSVSFQLCIAGGFAKTITSCAPLPKQTTAYTEQGSA
jgi:hypothetical protein